MPEPIFLTSCIDIENEEEMENDDSANENTTELTKMVTILSLYYTSKCHYLNSITVLLFT